jgi:hypothetical protein
MFDCDTTKKHDRHSARVSAWVLANPTVINCSDDNVALKVRLRENPGGAHHLERVLAMEQGKMAEGEGFEPSRRYDRLRDFQSRALDQAMRPFQLLHPPQRAERVGFEPTVAHHHTAFRERHLQPLGHLSSARVYQANSPKR